jgi:hypothetical protein
MGNMGNMEISGNRKGTAERVERSSEAGREITAKVEEATSGYLKLYGKNLPKGLILINKPRRTAVSEGVGFGGLILCSAQNQKGYWQINKARKEYFLKPSGVMAWEVDGSGKKISMNSASDGDQDWIASEIMAVNKIEAGEWEIPAGMSIADLKQQVQKDLSFFWRAHIKEAEGRLIFLPSDGQWAKRSDGRDIYFPSYPDPHFLRMFAEADRKHDWKKLIKDVQDLNVAIIDDHKNLGAAGQNPMPAKVFVSVSSGKYTVENYYAVSEDEGVRGDALKDNESDSIRFLLRMARAVILDNDVSSKDILVKLLAAAGIDGVATAHIYAGNPGAPSKWGQNNTIARACYGAAVYAVEGEQSANTFINSVANDFKGEYFGEWTGAQNYYFDQSLILQVLDLIYKD